MDNTSETRLLIIVNNIPPYVYEVINILASPRKSTCRFRYQTKYTPTIENPKGLEGEIGTIVLRNRKTAQFMPIRTMRVLTSDPVGDVIYITVELLHIVALSPDAKRVKEQTDEFSSLVSEQTGSFRNDPSDDLRNLVLYENGSVYNKVCVWDDSSDQDEITRWGNCIQVMARNNNLVDVDHYKVVKLRDEDGNPIPFSSPESDSTGYKVSKNSNYSLEILQRTYTQKKGDSSVKGKHFLELESYNDGITIPDARQPILGKYDLIHFNIKVSGSVQQKTVQTFLSAVVSNENSSAPALEIPLLVQTSWKYLFVKAGAVLFFAVFLASFVFSDAVSGWGGTQVISAEHIEKVSIVGMILTSSAVGLKEIASSLRLG